MLIRNWQIIFVFMLGFYVSVLNAEPATDTNSNKTLQGLSFGFDLGSIAGHLIHGVRISSPSFFNGYARAALSGHLGWVQNVMSITDKTYSWLPYGLMKLGIQIGAFLPNSVIRIASFADLAMAIPSLKISSKSVIFGLAGGIEAEIFFSSLQKQAVFFSMGGIGLFSPIADGLIGQPSFANGFTTSFGFRYYF